MIYIESRNKKKKDLQASWVLSNIFFGSAWDREQVILVHEKKQRIEMRTSLMIIIFPASWSPPQEKLRPA